MKNENEKKPVAERIFLYKDEELVTFASLTEEEKKTVRAQVTEKLADGLMEPAGYRRVGKRQKSQV